MKISVSLVEEDVSFVDEYAAQAGATSRSAVIHQAIALLREADLEEAYDIAWADWDGSADAELSASTAGDGVTDASR